MYPEDFRDRPVPELPCEPAKQPQAVITVSVEELRAHSLVLLDREQEKVATDVPAPGTMADAG